MTTPPDVALSRLGQIKGSGATWGPGATGLDADRALMLKLGSAEILDAFLTSCIFKGKTRERNIRGGKSVAFPILGKQSARYHQPGTPILGEGNSPSDINERVISLDALMIADKAIYNTDELMTYFDVRQDYTRQLGQSLAVEWDKRVARMIYAAATNTTEPLNKNGGASPKGPTDNTGRIGSVVTLPAGYGSAATKQAKGDFLVDAITDARIALEKKDVGIEGMYAVCTPEAFFEITSSSRAINADFNGASGGNGTIANGVTAQVMGIPLYMSNHVEQEAYELVAGDYNADYEQDLSKCKILVFHREAVGVLTLLQPSLQLTGPEFRVQFQSDLMVARQAIGMGVLRAECAVAIETS